MKEDSVIERIRKVRTKISEEHDHDMTKLVRHYQELEKATTRKFFKRDIKGNKVA